MPYVILKLAHEERRALCSASFMTDRVFDDYLIKHSTVLQSDSDGVSDRALLWVVIVRAELRVLDAGDFCAQLIDAWVGSGSVTTVRSRNMH